VSGASQAPGSVVASGADVSALLSLKGRVALVTGGGGGIGAAVCALLRDAGAAVVSADVTDAGPDGVKRAVCDVSDPAAAAALVARVGSEYGRLDLLVHCAGITRDAVLWKLSDEDWRRVLSVNLDAAFYLLKAATSLLRKQGGSVVLVSSINGERGKFGQSNYAASKAGLIALAKTAARELGAFGVRVNALAPGLIETAMTASLPQDMLRRAAEESALGRAGKPEDVARAALFLCSDLSRHVTGQVLRVDGGQLMA